MDSRGSDNTAASAPAGAGALAARPTVCVFAGSPRVGASVALAEQVARGLEQGGCQVDLVRLADWRVRGCTGCGACEACGACVLDAGDDMPALRERLMEAGALALVAPLYFAGPPAQLKAVFDRLEPLWAQRYLLGVRPPLPHAARRPLDLVVVGGGGDPFGCNPLVTSAHSALRMMDFELSCVRDAVGYRAPRNPAAPPRPCDEEFECRACAWGEDLARRVLEQAGDRAAPLVSSAPHDAPKCED